MIHRLTDRLAQTSPWLVFLPFGLLYAFIAVTAMDNSQLVMDEVRYWGFGENLLNGHFHYKTGDNFLWSGPGYPLTLVPFVAFSAHLAVVKFMNAIYLYLSVVLLYKTVQLYLPRRTAFIVAFLWAAYFPFYEFALPLVMTEGFTVLTVTFMMYTVARAFRRGDRSWRKLLLPGFAMAFMVLTKIIFGYVILLVAAILGFAYLIRRKNAPPKLLPMARLMALAVLFLLPYLSYTYALTSKPLYWGNTGGLSLYWMSSPHEGELGDWHGPSLREHPQLKANHGEFFASIADLDPVAKDDALKKQAIANIKSNPKKFVYNCIANAGRTFFSYPLSFLEPSNGIYKYLIPHMFLLAFGLSLLWPTFRHRQRFPAEMLLLLGIVIIYLGETVIVSSYVRFFMIVVPIFLWWIAYGLHHFVKVDFSEKNGGATIP